MSFNEGPFNEGQFCERVMVCSDWLDPDHVLNLGKTRELTNNGGSAIGLAAGAAILKRRISHNW